MHHRRVTIHASTDSTSLGGRDNDGCGSYRCDTRGTAGSNHLPIRFMVEVGEPGPAPRLLAWFF